MEIIEVIREDEGGERNIQAVDEKLNIYTVGALMMVHTYFSRKWASHVRACVHVAKHSYTVL